MEDVCVTDCTCAAITPVGQTCSNGCGGLCQGTQQTSCVPNWQCTAWSVCSSLCQKTRTCTDTNHCNVQCGDASCVTADACTGDSCVATQTCSQGGFYCCPTGYTCNDIRSGTGCVGTCCGGSGACIAPTTQTCSQMSENICTTSEQCSVAFTTSSDSARCCTGTCSAITETCEERLDCEIFEDCNKEETKCEMASWVYLVIGFIALMFIMNMMPRG